MSLRGTRPERTETLASHRCVLAVRNRTLFAFPAEIVRGLGATADGSGPAQRTGSAVDLLTHFPGTSASGVPGRELLYGRHPAQHAVLVDDIIGLTEVAHEQIRPLPAQFTGPERVWFSGMFLFRDGVALLLNADWLLMHDGSAPAALAAPAEASDHAAPADPIEGVALEEATDGEDTPWAEL